MVRSRSTEILSRSRSASSSATGVSADRAASASARRCCDLGDIGRDAGSLFDHGGAPRLVSRDLPLGVGGAFAQRIEVLRALRTASLAACSSRVAAATIVCAFSASDLRTTIWSMATRSCCSSSFSRFRPARRRAAGVSDSAVAINPSQRQRSPSTETSRWPGESLDCRRLASARETMPICARRRARAGGTSTTDEAASRLRVAPDRCRTNPSGPNGSARRRRPEPSGLRRARRQARPRSPASRDVVDDRRPQLLGLDVEHLGERARLDLIAAQLGIGGLERGAGLRSRSRAVTRPVSAAAAAASVSASQGAMPLPLRRRDRRDAGRGGLRAGAVSASSF